jgi:hypothetical protein
VQKARDLPAKRCVVQEVTHRGSIVEEFPLQLSGQSPPLHDQGRPEKSQNMLLFPREANMVGRLALQDGLGLFLRKGASGILGVGSVQRLIIVLREPFRVVRKLGESLLEFLIFALVVGLIAIRAKLPNSRAFARYCCEVNISGLSEEHPRHFGLECWRC